MYKSLFKYIYYETFNFLQLSDALIRNKINSQKVILTYHNVLPEELITPYFTNFVDVSVETLEQHILFLKQRFHINDISLLRDPEVKGFFLSFDDAMLNNVEIVAPILKKHDLTAMFAACSGLVSGEIKYLWRDEIFLFLSQSIGKEVKIPLTNKIEKKIILRENLNTIANFITQHIQQGSLMDTVYEYINKLKEINKFVTIYAEPLRYRAASLEDLSNLKESGHLIASHTISHKKLSFLDRTQQEEELKRSKEYFDMHLGETDCLVFPFGTSMEVNKECLMLAEKVGYKYAFMNAPGSRVHDYAIPRTNITNIQSKSVFKGVLARINKF